jgi:hypothetical protein
MKNKPVEYVVHSHPGSVVCSDLRAMVLLLPVLINRAKIQTVGQLTSCIPGSTQWTDLHTIWRWKDWFQHFYTLTADLLSYLLNSSTIASTCEAAVPATCHGGAWGERRYSSYSHLTSALEGSE